MKKKIAKAKKIASSNYYIRSLLSTWISGVAIGTLTLGCLILIIFMLYYRLM